MTTKKRTIKENIQNPKYLAKFYKYYFNEFSLKIFENMINIKSEKIRIEKSILEKRNITSDKLYANILFYESCNGATIETLSKKFDFPIYKVKKLINLGRKQLLSEINKDIENNLLKYEPKKTEPQKTKMQILKDWNLFLAKNK